MKPVKFSLHRPTSLDEAVQILADDDGATKVLAGGQSLIPLMNFRLARPSVVVDIGRIAVLGKLRRTYDEVSIGATVRQRHAETSRAVADAVPLMAAALPHVAHPAIRSRGTIGGSLAHADPAAELPAVARALDATMVVASPRGRREIAAEDFFVSNLMTALQPDELLVEVTFPPSPAGTGAAFEEVGRRRGDFALVGVAAQVTLHSSSAVLDCRVCVTGVAATPFRAVETERMLVGDVLTPAKVHAAAAALRESIQPSSDLHASGEYRQDVAGVLFERAIEHARDRAIESLKTTQSGSGGHDVVRAS